MNVQNVQATIRSQAGSFLTNFMEGSVLGTIVTLAPHIFKRYVNAEFPVLMDIPTSIASTIAGAVAYSAYMTVFKPMSNQTHETLASIPKNVSEFGDSLLADKDTDTVKKKSVYSTPLWGLGMLSLFGYGYSVASSLPLPAPYDHPVLPVVLSAGGTLLASWGLNQALIAIVSSAKESNLVAKTCEAVEHVWNFGGGTIKAAAIGLGIVGAARLNENFIKPIVGSSLAEGAITTSSTLWGWTTTVIETVSPYVASGASGSWSALQTTGGFISGLIFRKDTLDSCVKGSLFLTGNSALCTSAKSVDLVVTHVLNPVGSAISTTAGWMSSSTKTALGVVTGGVGILSGLIFREDTLKKCAAKGSPFLTANPSLCANAAKLNTFITDTANPTGTVVYDYLAGFGENISGLAGKAIALSGPVLSKVGSLTSDLTGKAVNSSRLALNGAVTLAMDPTVQQGTLIVVAAGVSLFALHFIATKTMDYFAQETALPVAVLVEGDIEQGEGSSSVVAQPIEVGTGKLSPEEMMDQLRNYKRPLPPAANTGPSAPPAPPEMLAELEEPLPAIETAEPPVTLWSSFQNKVTSFIAGVAAVGVWIRDAIVSSFRKLNDFLMWVGDSF